MSNQGVQTFAFPAPTGKLNRQPFSGREIQDIMKSNVDWLKSFDIQLNANHRHVKYMELLNKYPNLAENMEADGGIKNQLNYAVYEVHEIDRIRRYLVKNPKLDLRNRLLDYIKGPPHYDDENPNNNSNHARNIGLELAAGSDFIRRGFEIKFSELAKDPEPTIMLDEYTFPVQCKRIASRAKVQLRLADAIKQLKINMERDSSLEPGIVVLDVTRLISENFSIRKSHTELPHNLKNQHQAMEEIIYSTFRGFKPLMHPCLQMVLFRGSWVEHMQNIDEYWFNYATTVQMLCENSPLNRMFRK